MTKVIEFEREIGLRKLNIYTYISTKKTSKCCNMLTDILLKPKFRISCTVLFVTQDNIVYHETLIFL